MLGVMFCNVLIFYMKDNKGFSNGRDPLSQDGAKYLSDLLFVSLAPPGLCLHVSEGLVTHLLSLLLRITLLGSSMSCRSRPRVIMRLLGVFAMRLPLC